MGERTPQQRSKRQKRAGQGLPLKKGEALTAGVLEIESLVQLWRRPFFLLCFLLQSEILALLWASDGHLKTSRILSFLIVFVPAMSCDVKVFRF